MESCWDNAEDMLSRLQMGGCVWGDAIHIYVVQLAVELFYV